MCALNVVILNIFFIFSFIDWKTTNINNMQNYVEKFDSNERYSLEGNHFFTDCSCG